MGIRHTEYHMCVSLVEWFAYAHKGLGIPEHLLVHVPNQAGGNPRTGMHLRKMGVRKGVPDYILLSPNKQGKHGLFLEMKSATGKLSPEQVNMAATLSAQGYSVITCRSAMEARDAIENYIKGTPAR